MSLLKYYRSWILATAALLATTALAGCESVMHDNQTMKQETADRWNATRCAVMLQLATQQYQVGDYDKCRETLGQAFMLNHPLAPLHLLAARVELEKGSLEVADHHLKLAVQIDPADAEAYYLLGVLYQRWQNNQAAHDYYKLAFDKKPAEAIFLLALVEMKITLGNYDEARKLLEEKVIYFEQSAAVRVALAKLYTLQGQFEQACKFYREATILSPDDAALRRDLAEAYFFAGRYTEALPVLQHLLSDTPHSMETTAKDEASLADDPSVHLLLARTYAALHRLPEAINLLRDMVRTDPHQTLAWLTLGKAQLEMGDLPEAGLAARRLLKYDPENLEALILLGAVQQKGREWSQAAATLDHALHLAPKDVTVLCMQGLNVQNQGHAAQAAAFYQQALAAKPGDAWARELLASATDKMK